MLARSGNMVKTVLIADLLHDMFEDEETGEAPKPATVSRRVSDTTTWEELCIIPKERIFSGSCEDIVRLIEKV